ncbi:MAG: iron permease, partial [Bacteriovoracaceae bacterium]|nr:iron permease [Bacteriovoracaceae bacterium]
MKAAIKLSLFFCILIAGFRASFAAGLEESPRALVHLLDYLAGDYGGAVKDGKILVQSEFDEQKEFVATALEIGSALSKDSAYLPVKKDLSKLQKLISSKADVADVSSLAIQIKKNVLQISKLPVAPIHWPNLQNGKKIFEGQCATCHGMTGEGNGPLAKNFKPQPRNFLDEDMKNMSPFHAFNVVKLGIPGTGMLPFPQLSDAETWDISFYLLSLRSKGLPKSAEASASLEEVSTLSDVQLLNKLSGDESSKQKALAALRLKSAENIPSSLPLARSLLSNAEKAYLAGSKPEARKFALAAYLEGVEPIEPQLRATHSGLTNDLEKAMAQVRSVIEASKPSDEIHQKIQFANLQISNAEIALQKNETSVWMIFSIAAGIVFREGFEAVLIIMAILGVIRAASAKKAARFVHGGWLIAILIGVAAWFFSGWMIYISGAQRELSEGIGSLLAVAVLLYMGFWLHSKTEIRRWTAFINGKVKKALEGSSRWGLFALAFVAVFREALETVLFMRALTLEGDRASELAMLGGVATSFVAIFILAWAFLKYSVSLPVRQLFAISSWIMVGLSIILIGKGLHSFQEMGFVSVTSISLPLEIPFVG